MPPSHHSSSSHSSHHSSSHSSSHRHSSSSHGSSYRGSSYSGPGRHSSTSYSSGTRSTIRPRVNQPKNYDVHHVARYVAPRHYHCVTHDYVYYANSWYDDDGKLYKRGFYDENGVHYDDIKFKQNEKTESIFYCEYCGCETKMEWNEGIKPTCPHCGATLQETVGHTAVDEIIPDSNYGAQTGPDTGKNMVGKCIIIYVVCVFVIGFLINLISCINTFVSNRYDKSDSWDYEEYYDDYDDDYVDPCLELFGDSIYVEEIGRTCYWDDNSECYYDEETDCYFWYNTEWEPNVWQYWYEDISSNYGDYGWMEYDADADQWYIESYSGEWEPLPSEYMSSRLWHFE